MMHKLEAAGNRLGLSARQRILAGVFLMTFAVCCAVLLPPVRNGIILFGELLVQRPLTHPVWHARFIIGGLIGIVFHLIFFVPFFLNRLFPQTFSAKMLMNIFVMAIIVVAIAPVIFLGQSSIIPIPDNLNNFLPEMKMLQDNGLLLSLDSPTPCLGNMSTAYYNYIPYNVLLLPYVFFDVFTAHVIGYILKILIGYGSMFLLLTHFFADDESAYIIKLVSLCFALLPSCPAWWIAVDSVPLLCYFFILIKELPPAKIDKRIFFLLFFPFLSSFPPVGFFLVCLWAICTVWLWVYKKKLHWNLLGALISLVIGYILVDLKLFYAKFILQEPLNRALYGQEKVSFIEALKTIPISLLYGGNFHGPFFAHHIIFPAVFVTVLSIAIFIFYKKLRSADEKHDAVLANYLFTALILLGLHLLFALIGDFHNSRSVSDLVNTVFPFLKGFSLRRFLILNRTVLYILFALTLITLLRFKRIRYFAYVIACVQIIVVLHGVGASRNMYNIYNYFSPNFSKVIQEKLFSESDIDTWLWRPYMPYHSITYGEFFSEQLFNDIKTDLRYNGEGVAALGYHPGVLMYNGFSTIDGYRSTYPLKYYHTFREIIAPQLELSAEHKKYYDGWGWPLYFFNNEVGYEPTRDRVKTPVTLHINVEAFRTLGGVYILSRAEIKNAEDMQLRHVRTYSNDNSIYEIFVYKVI